MKLLTDYNDCTLLFLLSRARSPTSATSFFDVSQFPTAQARADAGHFSITSDVSLLSAREVSTFLDYSLAISVMRGATEAEIDDVFARINTYGHQLSDQERRQAGVQDEFSTLVRELACEIRGDASSEILDLAQMPSISIDLPMTKHGYEVIADEVFWVNQGVLRSTDLRDSMDEQCLADIAACIVGGQMIDRAKDALDRAYQSGSAENSRLVDALDVYGAERLKDELKYCIDELLAVCDAGGSRKLRSIIFAKASTNAFPAVFTVLMVALHEALIGEQKKIADYKGVKSAITGLYSRIDTSRRATSPEERRKNLNTIKGLINSSLVPGSPQDYRGNHSSTDIDVVIRRSEIELPSYELKQGILRLDTNRELDRSVFEKVIETICAIANNGPNRSGSIVIGVTDKEADATRAKLLDKIEPRRVGRRYVVGVRREAAALNETVETYLARWKNSIRNSKLSQPLRDSILSSIDYNDYYGLGIIVITVPPQAELSYVNEEVFWREVDETKKAIEPRTVAQLARRFS
ncbi:ATP-binding protein [Amycolatopsis sp. BJA-103]|uniref:ATP-binding protein n=1 Tax=Amycolatopsis sp. BJA-103 TaxID=1911175 RepID=UPI001E3FC489|nr:ATP-binding protein [Amycolatopsis sp. BJA-103]